MRMELSSNLKRTKLTIEQGDAKVVLNKNQILVLVITCLDLFGWGWLKEKLEDYAIYVNM